ncbi:PAAR domain-containing protein [Zymobacter sp. IVIA_5232.4 C2]|uniref:PAAR domain-containing protein n=1 Tax=Zymobacter sp. IVIA_5232.4 C2 TaxID=3394855 RepID=UPI0039C49E8A
MKGIIVLGDLTTHGGTVISAQSTYTVGGKPVACMGDKIACPLHGINLIIEGESSMLINGKPVALDGHRCACGCQLIASTSTHGHA